MANNDSLLLATVILILIILFFGFIIIKGCIEPYMDKINLCERNLGFNESSLFDTPNSWKIDIDDKHYNCCYYNLTNKDNIGYKKEVVCVGFEVK